MTPPPWVDRARAMRSEGATLRAIADHFDTTVSRVDWWLKRDRVLAERRAEVVYFLQAVEGGPIKIGRARSLERRLAGVQTGNPSPLRVTRVIPVPDEETGRRLEADLHRRFERHRLMGEWFEPVRELVDFACAVETPAHESPAEMLRRAYGTGYARGRADATEASAA